MIPTQSIREVVRDFYTEFDSLCKALQPIQAQEPVRQGEPIQAFTMPKGGSLFLRETKIRDKNWEVRRKTLFTQARYLMTEIYRQFKKCAKDWPEFQNSKTSGALTETAVIQETLMETVQTRAQKKQKQVAASKPDATTGKVVGGPSKPKVIRDKLQPLSLAEMRRNFMAYASTTKHISPEQAHELLKNPPRKVKLNPEQKDGVHRAVVQGLPVVNIQSPPGTGKTETAANVIAILGKTKPGKRVLAVTPTNLANCKLTHSILEAYVRYGGRADTEDYDILLLKSRHAALTAANHETALIKPKPGDEELIEKLKIRHHLIRLLQQIDEMKANPNLSHLVTQQFKGWNQDARAKIERYLEARKKDALAKVNEDLIVDRVLDWRKIRVIVCTDDLAILKPQLAELCEYMVTDEAGQRRHIQTLTLVSRMLIKTLFLVGD